MADFAAPSDLPPDADHDRVITNPRRLLYWHGLVRLVAAARGPEAYASIEAVYGSFLGLLVLFGFTFALMFHTLAGIRHLVWDLGKGLDLRSVEWGAVAVVAGSIVLTLFLWLVILLRGHAA